jgi:glutamate dehydrogenase/leucine dehydrogenase
MAEEHTPLSVALSQLKLASKKLQLDSGIHKMLSLPKRAISVNIDIRMDNGSIGVFNGIRVQHWDARGPFKGGIRYYPNITIDEVAIETFAAVPRQANVQQILKSLCTPSIHLFLMRFAISPIKRSIRLFVILMHVSFIASFAKVTR